MKFMHGIALSLCLAALTGCADDANVGASPITVDPLNQSWTLDGVGDWRVPVSVGLNATTSRQISGGALTVRPDWTWEFRYEYRDLGATVDTRGTSISAGTYAVQEGAPSTLTLREGATAVRHVGTVNPDGSVDLPIQGLRYHFVPAR